MTFIIAVTGPAADLDMKVTAPCTDNEVMRFDTRAEARTYMFEVLPLWPKSYLPLVVREES